MRPPTLFFFKIVLAIQDPLRFFVDFRMDFSVTAKCLPHFYLTSAKGPLYIPFPLSGKLLCFSQLPELLLISQGSA